MRLSYQKIKEKAYKHAKQIALKLKNMEFVSSLPGKEVLTPGFGFGVDQAIENYFNK